MEVVRHILTALCRSANEAFESFQSNKLEGDDLSVAVANAGTLLVAISGMVEDLSHYSSTHGPNFPMADLETLVALAGKIVDSVELASIRAESTLNYDVPESNFELEFIEYELRLLFGSEDSVSEPAPVLHKSILDEYQLDNLLVVSEPTLEMEKAKVDLEDTALLELEVEEQVQASPELVAEVPVPPKPMGVEAPFSKKVIVEVAVLPEVMEQVQVKSESAVEVPVPPKVTLEAQLNPEEMEQVQIEPQQVEQQPPPLPLQHDEPEFEVNPIEEMMVAAGEEPLLCYIKTAEDQLPTVSSNFFWRRQNMRNRDIWESCAIVFRAQLQVVVSTPGENRLDHFDNMNPWLLVPPTINDHFQSNLLDMDSARIFETLAVSSDMVFSPSQKKRDDFNIAFLCPPSGGVVPGTKMFLDLIHSDLNVKWVALTSHPWKETMSMDNVLVDDSNLFWNHENWKFVLDPELAIETEQEMTWVVKDIKEKFPKLDLLVADLSPALLLDACVTHDIISMKREMKRAFITEAAQLEVALWTLCDGGSLVLSLVDPCNIPCTLGGISIMTGLFESVAVAFPRPSAEWIRPAALVCSGYVGLKHLKATYPNFTTHFLNAIVDNIENGNRQILFEPSDLPQAITTRIATMTTAWAEQEDQRLRGFIASFGNIPAHAVEEVQDIALDSWMNTILSYIPQNALAWNIYVEPPLVINDVDALHALQEMERNESNLNLGLVRMILKRLQAAYMQTLPSPATLNATFKNVNTSKLGAVVVEQFHHTITFSRFTFLQLTYDRYIARTVAAWFPTLGFAEEIETGVPVTCISHVRNTVRSCLSNFFQMNFNGDAFAVDCLNISTQRRLGMSDAEFHEHVLLMIMKHLSRLERKDTLFLCKCPLTTRLLLGMLCLFKNCFKETRLVICDEMKVVGILLVEFRGSRNEVTKRMQERFDNILKQMNNNFHLDMEPVPLASILKSIDMGSLMEYNNTVVRNELRSTVNVLVGKLSENYTATPFY